MPKFSIPVHQANQLSTVASSVDEDGTIIFPSLRDLGFRADSHQGMAAITGLMETVDGGLVPVEIPLETEEWTTLFKVVDTLLKRYRGS